MIFEWRMEKEFLDHHSDTPRTKRLGWMRQLISQALNLLSNLKSLLESDEPGANKKLMDQELKGALLAFLTRSL